MMTWIIATVCLFVLAGLAALWLSPLRVHVCNAMKVFDRFKFTCRVEQYSDESQPAHNDQFFRVDMIGRIDTAENEVDTDVRLEIVDITEGRNCPQQVFSTDEDYRSDDSADFYYQKRNGVVPEKKAVLARWVTVAQFPCHTLRFACRGRRKLLFRVSIIENQSGRELSVDSHVAEYVYCQEGYREAHDRRMDVLGACIELSAATLDGSNISDEIRAFWSTWVQEKVEMLISAEEASGIVDAVGEKHPELSPKQSSEMILGYGQNTDRFCAMEMVLQTVALSGQVTNAVFDKLLETSAMLEIKKDRFFEAAQKILLSSDCHFQDLSRLFDLNAEMDEESFRKRLNEEYRKWNARVTHPNAQVRQQADRMLTLIADIRSQTVHCSS